MTEIWRSLEVLLMRALFSRLAARLRNGLVGVPLIPISAYQCLIRRNVIGLCYHLVSDETVEHVAHLYPYKGLEVFEEHLLYLRENYRLLSYDEMRSMHTSGASSKNNGIFLSFDDGMVECMTVVRPLLLKHQIPCTFFLTTDFIDNANLFYRHKTSLILSRLDALNQQDRADIRDRVNAEFDLSLPDFRAVTRWVGGLGYSNQSLLDQTCIMLGIDVAGYLRTKQPYLSTDQVATLVADGFTVGAHSKTHPLLGRLSQEAQADEILQSSIIIRERTGAKEIPFAFPFSGDGVDRNLLREMKSKLSFLGLFFDLHGFRKDAEFVVNRIWCESSRFSPSPDTPLPRILRHAYQSYWLEHAFPG